MWNQMSLPGKRVVVTAGANGIGLEIARAFAAAGSTKARLLAAT